MNEMAIFTNLWQLRDFEKWWVKEVTIVVNVDSTAIVCLFLKIKIVLLFSVSYYMHDICYIFSWQQELNGLQEIFTLESWYTEIIPHLHLTLPFCQSRLSHLTSHLHHQWLMFRKASIFPFLLVIYKWLCIFPFLLVVYKWQCIHYFEMFYQYLFIYNHVSSVGEPVFGVGHAIFNEEYDLLASGTSGIVSKVHRIRNTIVMIQVTAHVLILISYMYIKSLLPNPWELSVQRNLLSNVL